MQFSFNMSNSIGYFMQDIVYIIIIIIIIVIMLNIFYFGLLKQTK